jgi:hypothetical protein
MRRKRKVEDLELASTAFGARRILEHYLERVARGEVVGLMVVAELPGGGAEMKMSSTLNVAERLGRLVLLKEEVIERAVEAQGDA